MWIGEGAISNSGPIILHLLPQSGHSAMEQLGWIISFCKSVSVFVAIVLKRTWRVIWLLLYLVAIPWQALVWTSWSNLSAFQICEAFYIRNIRFLYSLSFILLLFHRVPSLFNLVCSRRQKSTTQQVFLTVTCCDTKAHVLRRIVAPRPDLLPNSSFVFK